jgi:hypothetical protein
LWEEVEEMRLSLKSLEQRMCETEDRIQLRIEQAIFPLRNRVTTLERILKGGVVESEGLFFRVTLLEKLIDMKKHVKPVTKKQMKEIRKLIRAKVTN